MRARKGGMGRSGLQLTTVGTFVKVGTGDGPYVGTGVGTAVDVGPCDGTRVGSAVGAHSLPIEVPVVTCQPAVNPLESAWSSVGTSEQKAFDLRYK